MSDFWTRRKAAVEAEARDEAEAAAAALRAEQEAKAAEKPDEELLQELGLPEPESLGEGDDFRPFLGEAIPARLKTRALRRLWRVKPLLANLDGLVDYGEDFTDSATVVEDLQTVYEVGRGMLSRLGDLAREAEPGPAETAPTGAGEDSAAPETAPTGGGEEAAAAEDAPTEAATAPRAPEAAAAAAEVSAGEGAEPEAGRAPPRRRMTFVFEQRTA